MGVQNGGHLPIQHPVGVQNSTPRDLCVPVCAHWVGDSHFPTVSHSTCSLTSFSPIWFWEQRCLKMFKRYHCLWPSDSTSTKSMTFIFCAEKWTVQNGTSGGWKADLSPSKMYKGGVQNQTICWSWNCIGAMSLCTEIIQKVVHVSSFCARDW